MKSSEFKERIAHDLEHLSWNTDGIENELSTLSNYWAEKYYDLFSSLITPLVWVMWIGVVVIVIGCIMYLIEEFNKG